jgi:hypothetical protein
MIPLLIITGLFCLMIFVFIGLNLSENIEDFTSYILFWIVYGMVTFSVTNVFILGYFWSVIRKKTGPPGIRGPRGDMGEKGDYGRCDTSSDGAICMAELSNYIDQLYRDSTKTKTSILDNGVLVNGYMKRKIATICNSVQFEIISEVLKKEGKGSGNLIEYMKDIFTEWFKLIHSQNDKWFADPNGLERYNWKSNNPFNEIKKYDIFYWGDTRKFKPLKNKICKSELDQNSSSHIGLPLSTLRSNDYDEIYDDTNSEGSSPMKVFRPKKYEYSSKIYYPIGDIIVTGLMEKSRNKIGKKKEQYTRVGDLEFVSSNDNGPDKETILVSGDVVDPIDYKLMWRDQKYTNAYMDELRRGINAVGSGYMEASTGYGAGRIWKPVAPNGYVCLGDVVTNFYPPNHPDREEFLKYNKEVNIKCIPEDCAEELKKSYILDHKKKVWFVDNNVKQVVFNGEIYTIGDGNEPSSSNSYNLFRSDNMSYVNEKGEILKTKGDPFYKIKENCSVGRSGNIVKPKEVNPDFEKIGLGWYGTPANDNPKYSIYSFMGLIPEGMIEHIINKKRYYIVHYGGNEFNCYNIKVLNTMSGNYDSALEVQDGAINVGIVKVNNRNKKQQWRAIKYDNDGNEVIYFQSIYNDKVLQIKNDKFILSDAHTQSSNSYFEFTPAFGTGLNLL